MTFLSKEEKLKAQPRILELAGAYMKDRDRKHLEAIQAIVDEAGDAFVMVVGQKDGIPYSVTFNPKEVAPIVPDDVKPAGDSLS